MSNEPFSAIFKAARKAAGLTQTGAALVIRASARTVQDIESGATVPPVEIPRRQLTQAELLAALAKHKKPEATRKPRTKKDDP